MRLSRSSGKLLRANKFFAALLFATVFFAGFIAFNEFFKVRKITVAAPDEHIKIIGLEAFMGSNMIFLSQKDIGRFLYARNSHLGEIQVTKKYPAQLHITVTTVHERAQLAAIDGYFILSPSGRILRKTKSPQRSPLLITYYQRINPFTYTVGDTISYKDIQYALRFMTSFEDLGLTSQRVDISSNSMIAFTLQDKKIYFTTQKEYYIQEHQLKTVIRQLKVEGKEFEWLDLRFEKPVIKFKT